ncbi:MAG: prepilin peptidase [Patescibacteria group bacterium]
MQYAVLFFIFTLGAVIGSFLNVVIFRFNTSRSLSGRSVCLYCGKVLSWYELIPIVSFLLLRGRCASCKSRLSVQYPLVELSTAIIFVLTFYKIFPSLVFEFSLFPLLVTCYLLICFSFLIVISAYDLRHFIIPDTLAYLFAALAFLRPFLFPFPGEDIIYAVSAGPLLALPFAALHFASRGRWMGLGDAKLALGLGFFLGLVRSTFAFIFSFWIGALVSLILLFLGRRGFTMKSEIPFAPFLAVGAAIAFFTPLDYLLSMIFI